MADDSSPEVSQGSTHSVDLPPIAAPEPIFNFESAAEKHDSKVTAPIPDGDKTVISGSDGQSLNPSIRAGSPQEIAAQLLGQSLGHFNLDQFVGGGGMGAVFRAHDQQLDRTVAIKVLSKGHGEEEVVKRFRIEAQSAARLDHENIARVFYVGEDRGWDYIVFEFIDGANLRDLVQTRGPLSLEETTQYALQMAAALQHAYERDVVHRDIKPSNVLVTASGQVKLVDMGLARVHDIKREGDLTESGVTLGTFDYISPEQARDPRNADVRSDLYSLGCTLYFILTGLPPFPEGNFFQKLLKHQNERHADPRLLRPDLDEDFVAVLDKLLAKQPSKRYQTPDELISALLSVADKLGIEAASPRIAAAMKTLPRRSRWQAHLSWMLPLSLMLLGIWGFDAYLKSSEGASGPPSGPRLKKAISSSATSVEITENNANAAEVAKTEPTNQLPGPYLNTKQPPQSLGPRQRSPGEKYGDLNAVGKNLASRDWLKKPNSANATSADNGGVSNPTSPSAAPAGMLIVTDDAKELALGQQNGFYSSLKDAILSVAERTDSEIKIIEIRTSAPLVETAIQIQAAQLTIRSANGAAVVKFPAPTDGFSSRTAAIVQMGGVVRWEGIQFDWDLPDSMSRATALMELRDTQRTLFSECVFTAKAGDNAFLTQDSPAFLRVESTVEGGMMNPDMMTGNPTTTVIDLKDCIVRGEATLLKAAPTSTLTLRWEEGLFASGKRLAEFRGTSKKPVTLAKAEIELTRVTVQALEGLVKTTTTVDDPYAIPTHLNLRDSFISGPPDSPLVVNQHPPEKNFETTPLIVDGEGNTYFGPTTLWADASVSGKVVAFKIKDLVIPWYRESTPGLAPSLLAPQLGNWIPSETATPDVFLSSTESFRRGGFTPERLPLPIE